MEADTKNRKGRPRSAIGELARAYEPVQSIRAQTNQLYATMCIQLNEATLKPFFVTKYGKFRRQGIAEQIGRMREEGIATDTELLQLTYDCIEDYNNGKSVKEIERALRTLRY